MASSVIPALIDTLVTQIRAALPSLQVFDGFGVSEDPGDFLMVGVDDPDGPNPALSANSTVDWATMRRSPSPRDEQGTLTCAALSWNGDADPKAARDAAYATVDAAETVIRNDPTLGLAPTLLWVRLAETNLSQQQDGDGAQALIVFQLTYRARV